MSISIIYEALWLQLKHDMYRARKETGTQQCDQSIRETHL